MSRETTAGEVTTDHVGWTADTGRAIGVLVGVEHSNAIEVIPDHLPGAGRTYHDAELTVHLTIDTETGVLNIWCAPRMLLTLKQPEQRP